MLKAIDSFAMTFIVGVGGHQDDVVEDQGVPCMFGRFCEGFEQVVAHAVKRQIKRQVASFFGELDQIFVQFFRQRSNA